MSIKYKLFFWFFFSLIFVVAYFYLAIHFYSLPYGNVFFFILLIILAVCGYIVIRKITNSLTLFSRKIKEVNSLNLKERVKGFENNDEIGELAFSFNDLLDRLHQSFQRERQFIGDVAHELKTPLSIQRSNIEVTLSRRRETQEYRRVLNEMLIDNERMSKMLNNILDLAWSKSDVIAHFEIFDLSELMEEIVDLATKMASYKKIKIIGEIGKNIKMHGKRDKLFHAIVNIVDNAIKYTKDGGTVSITLHKTDQRIHLEIKDNGIGIAKDDLPHIFERFYRGSKNDKTSGSGLGLAIAAAIISSHRGKIDIESSLKHGTTVSISFVLIKSS